MLDCSPHHHYYFVVKSLLWCAVGSFPRWHWMILPPVLVPSLDKAKLYIRVDPAIIFPFLSHRTMVHIYRLSTCPCCACSYRLVNYIPRLYLAGELRTPFAIRVPSRKFRKYYFKRFIKFRRLGYWFKICISQSVFCTECSGHAIPVTRDSIIRFNSFINCLTSADTYYGSNTTPGTIVPVLRRALSTCSYLPRGFVLRKSGRFKGIERPCEVLLTTGLGNNIQTRSRLVSTDRIRNTIR